MNSTFMLQSYVTSRHTDAEKEHGVAPSVSQQMRERPRLFAHFKTLKSEVSNNGFQYD